MQRSRSPWNLAFSLVALLLSASPVWASGGLNLSWGDCGNAGTLQRTFACDTNVGADVLYLSVVAPVPVGQLDAVEMTLYLRTDQPVPAPWWHFETGGCRGGLSPPALGFSIDFTANSACADPWFGLGAAGGTILEQGPYVFGQARLRAVAAIPGTTSIDNTTEYYLCKIVISHQRTLTCAGCAGGACIEFQTATLAQPAGVGDVIVSNPLGRNFVVWQSGIDGTGSSCPGPVPTRASTWGSIKAMYR